ncbi:hypothetical protein JW898_00900 [Candidatus Woesearchaeota archaeon]|nr:hypothetical protein [Candidatus Woesearchaeota archaeon]
MDHREKLLSIVKENGPLLPAQINKELRTNVLFASAMLAEMVDQKKLRLTSMKVGGSPLYYCEGQEHLIERFADRLGQQESAAFGLLKGSKILRDRDQDPQTRVALREIKDFAVPLEVTANGYSDLFWKYYLVSDDDAQSLIKDYINRREEAKEDKTKGAEEPEETEEERPKEVQATIGASALIVEPSARTEEVSAHPKKPVTSVTMTTLEQSEVPEFSYQPSVSFSTMIDTDEKVKIGKKRPEHLQQQESKLMVFPEDDEFFMNVRKFFDGAGMDILDFVLIRKGTEYDFVVKIPSNVGVLEYYCKAKSKSKINDGDLASAFVQGQIKKLPILFVTVGDLTKRAEELLSKEFRSMFVRKI